jgi:hypothetical protein
MRCPSTHEVIIHRGSTRPEGFPFSNPSQTSQTSPTGTIGSYEHLYLARQGTDLGCLAGWAAAGRRSLPLIGRARCGPGIDYLIAGLMVALLSAARAQPMMRAGANKWVSCPECVKYYSKPRLAAPMALEKSVHSLPLPQVSRGACDPIHSHRGFLSH